MKLNHTVKERVVVGSKDSLITIFIHLLDGGATIQSNSWFAGEESFSDIRQTCFYILAIGQAFGYNRWWMEWNRVEAGWDWWESLSGGGEWPMWLRVKVRVERIVMPPFELFSTFGVTTKEEYAGI
ncbi:unnamed protein product [Arabidopsis thaliana]|uniref:Uncharacterized protein n=2 Tax=Arabidopsis thaliana TaxID=3702 RepID=A0A654G1U0_ARATH|nr:uncharacterized protein AT5G17345 [Arabidopsis thaliana]ANM70440.1 hypothetical protein AT5G17345 [Arabidopsis thaliana]CAA0403196.1 unnamed protein product [Arabidopsis thaliana]VYS67112.1 unnamed protein product [Arabidopsis thaliana]|eukprot:NP_001332050.1 hypothetical protein AT5G17345 [Arabidopsis thaliana]